MRITDAKTDKQVFRVLTKAVRLGEVSEAEAIDQGVRYGIDFADFREVCDRCGATESQSWNETETGLECGECAAKWRDRQ